MDGNTLQIDNNLTLIVSCWDKYDDVRKVFFESLLKYWPTCPFRIVIAINSGEKFFLPGLKIDTIECPASSTGTERLIYALKEVNSKYVLLLHEDAIFYDYVNSDFVKALTVFIISHNIEYCKMINSPSKKGKKFSNPYSLKYINHRQPYGINICCSIYKKDYFLHTMDDTLSTWELENKLNTIASKMERGYYNDKVICTSNPLRVYFGVMGGKWSRKALKLCKQKGFSIDIERRKINSLWTEMVNSFKSLATRICPWKLRLFLKKVLTKLGFKFVTKY